MEKSIYALLMLVVMLVDQSLARPLFVGSSEGMNFEVEEIVSDLGVPWGMTFLSPSELLFTEREGKYQYCI